MLFVKLISVISLPFYQGVERVVIKHVGVTDYGFQHYVSFVFVLDRKSDTTKGVSCLLVIGTIGAESLKGKNEVHEKYSTNVIVFVMYHQQLPEMLFE
jgi:hypothetical protein